MYHKRSKKIDIKYHLIRDKVEDENGVVSLLLRVSSGEMVTDVLTKALATDAFEGHTISITGNVGL